MTDIRRVTKDELFRIKEAGKPKGVYLAPHKAGEISAVWYLLMIPGGRKRVRFIYGSFKDFIEAVIPFSGIRRYVDEVPEGDGIRAVKIGLDWKTEVIPADEMGRVAAYTGFSATVSGQKKRKIRVETELNYQEES